MRSRRYFKDAVTQKPQFQWTGDPSSPPSPCDKDKLVSTNQHLHYESFLLGELPVSVGHHVLVRNSDNNDNLLDCDVARVDRLFHDYGNKTDPYRAVVTWFCRPNFLPARLKQGHGLEEQGVEPLEADFEVTGEAREYDKNISAESIYYRCKVVEGGLKENPMEVSKRGKEGPYPCYLQRFDMVMGKNSNSRKMYLLEPLRKESLKKRSPKRRRALSESIGSGNLLEERKSGRLLDISQNTILNSPRSLIVDVKDVLKSRRRSCTVSSRRSSKDSSSPSELSSFVTATVSTATVSSPARSISPGLDGGYWGSQDSKKRTPKPTTRLVTENSGTPGRSVRDKLVVSELSTNSGRKLKIQFGTQMETATSSGRKVTLKCARREKFAPSTGLGNDKISSLLDSDTEDAPPPKATNRRRRASVSCTTPRRKTSIEATKINNVTPKKSVTKKRPASEMKSGRRGAVKDAEDSDNPSDDDFIPVSKKNNKKKVVRSQESSSSSEEESEEESDEEEEMPVRKKKKVVGATPAKSGSVSKTPKRVFKPSVAPRSKPLPASVDPLTEAQQRLHVSAVPDSLPCREEEFAEIFTYVESKLREGRGGCYYISGVPGTGKTATVMEVIRALEENKDDYPDFNFYAMNGMRLTSPEQAYVEMWKLLTGEKATSEHAMKLLAARFSKAMPKRATTIFLVDELDMLCNRKQSVLYNIFDWPSKPEGKLIVITIANTMDLPERVMINRVSSRLGLTRQTFQPYTHHQLQTIVASRLEGLAVFQQDAVQLVARKVASLSGDARRALDICRRATEMAEAGGHGKIGLKHVTGAYQEMFTSPKIQAIRSCSKYEQLVLQVLSSEFHRTGIEESSVGPVFRELTSRLRTDGLPVLSLPGVVAIVARLSAMRLILAEHFRHGLETKIRLNVASDDIAFALKQTDDDDE